MENKAYFIYVLLCVDGSFYGGYTTDVDHRFHQHQIGKGAKYTKSHRPLKLIYTKKFKTKTEALKAEYRFKHQSRQQKEKYLISHGVNQSIWLS